MIAPFTGRAWKFGDDVNTDVIFPGKYTYTLQTPEEMGKVAMEDAKPDFAKQAKPSDVVVAGKNFGCGSSREQAATCLKALGIGAVIARSFARIYYRNALNLGLPIIQCPEAAEAIAEGDEVSVNFEKGVITSKGRQFTFQRLPDNVLEILEAGGLIPHTRAKLKAAGKIAG
jgi:3-isopropylmalate/(R)-2-methylmalate dehydratase small subunit